MSPPKKQEWLCRDAVKAAAQDSRDLWTAWMLLQEQRGTQSMTLRIGIQENAKVLQYLKYALRLKEKPLEASVDEPHAEKTDGPSMK